MSKAWGAAAFEQPQALLEIARIDGADESVDQLRQLGRLPGGDRALRKRRGDRTDRRGDVGGILYRRQLNRYRTLAARRDRAIETKPHRPRVDCEGELNHPANARLGLVVKVQFDGSSLLM